MIPDAANALLASFKIWNAATVGGNICRSFAAAAMVSLAAALDGVAIVWTADGGDARLPVAELMTGNGTNTSRTGEVLRAIELPAYALARARCCARSRSPSSGARARSSPGGSTRTGLRCSP